jgi:protein TonB
MRAGSEPGKRLMRLSMSAVAVCLMLAPALAQPATRAPADDAGRETGATPAVDRADYHRRVGAHLARHRQYPALARKHRQEGHAIVSFRIDGAGRVESVTLSQRSGWDLLDSEVIAMVTRASPFPAPPSGQSLSFTVPVSFQMKTTGRQK